jgi:uncharacterized protein
VILGAINWGLVGLFNKDLVQEIFGADTLSRVIYGLIALSGIGLLFLAPTYRTTDLTHRERHISRDRYDRTDLPRPIVP